MPVEKKVHLECIVERGNNQRQLFDMVTLRNTHSDNH